MANEKIKVGLVEDDQMLSDMYKLKFQKSGFDIVSALDGAAGLEMVQKEKPDILLLDIIMPKLDGFQVLTEIRKTNTKLPVVLLTNLGQEEDIVKGRKLGATDYFVKSNFTPDAIVEKVRTILGKK